MCDIPVFVGTGETSLVGYNKSHTYEKDTRRSFDGECPECNASWDA